MFNWQEEPVMDNEIDWQLHTTQLREHLLRAQDRFKRQADKNRSEREFQVGEMVLLKLQPYAQSTVANRPCKKLSYKFFGPFKILQKVGNMAYKLELPENSKVHPVFYVSQLKPFTPNYAPVFSDLPKPPDLSAKDCAPVAILDRRMSKKGLDSVLQIKVKWSGLPETNATWEDYPVLRARYPSAGIWEGASSSEGGNVTTTSTQ
jgi:hypothetical protein